MPTRPRSSAARWLAALAVMFRWSSSVSVNCLPMVSTGLSDVIGSWNTIPMSLPRTFRICALESCRRSRPSKMTSPATILPGGSGISPMIESALTLLPQPLSPTMPTISPSSTEYEMPSTASTTPLSV